MTNADTSTAVAELLASLMPPSAAAADDLHDLEDPDSYVGEDPDIVQADVMKRIGLGLAPVLGALMAMRTPREGSVDLEPLALRLDELCDALIALTKVANVLQEKVGLAADG